MRLWTMLPNSRHCPTLKYAKLGSRRDIRAIQHGFNGVRFYDGPLLIEWNIMRSLGISVVATAALLSASSTKETEYSDEQRACIVATC